jgi:uncharacterized small protein (DUF1192 family)
MNRYMKPVLLACVIAGLAACGGASEESRAEGTAAQEAVAPVEVAATPAATPAASAPATPADAPLSVADLDAYVRGMQKEIELLKATLAKVEDAKQRKDDAAQTSAMLEVSMADRDTPAAAAAGHPVERWKHVKSRITTIIGGVAMRAQLAGMGGDTTDMTPEQKAEQEKNLAEMQAQIPDPYKDLDPAVVAALKARHDELAALHAESTGLLFKAASR